MSNWVTLDNGVHVDLDDPNNPVTGSGSYESYFGGGKGGSGSKGGSTFKKGQEVTISKGMPGEHKAKIVGPAGIRKSPVGDKEQVTVEVQYPWGARRENVDIDKITTSGSKGGTTKPNPGTKAAEMKRLKTAMDKWTMSYEDCQTMVDAITSNTVMKKQVLDAIEKDVEMSKQWADKEFPKTRAGKKEKEGYLRMVESDANYKRSAIRDSNWSVMDYADTAVRDDLIDIVRNTFGLKRPKYNKK